MDQILIIPDVHGRPFWKAAVESHPEMPTIFLGDYHDPYPYEKISESDSLANFREIIDHANTHANVQLLLGNHDLHYLCNFGEACRLDYENSAEIHCLLIDNLHRMKIADLRMLGDKRVLFSHAPILTDWCQLTGFSEDPEEITGRLNRLLESIVLNPWETEKMLGQTSPWRGGYDPVGSPVWADMNEIRNSSSGNLLPTVDYAVFGHTQLEGPKITPRWANLDSRRAFILNSDLYLTEI